MSGHSQFANIKHRKGAQDLKRSKAFVKIAKEITVAVKQGGSDINSNPGLRAAVNKAKANNMPKDNYLKIIKKAEGSGNDQNFTEIIYEGYGPGSVAVIIKCLTDNHIRTAANVRSYFNRFKGSLGQSNSVLYMFDQKGLIGFTSDTFKEDEVLEWVIENEAEDLKAEKNKFLITTNIKNFDKMLKFLNEKNVNEFYISEIKWIPNMETEVQDKLILEKIENFINLLNDDDDIQNVYTNLKIIA